MKDFLGTLKWFNGNEGMLEQDGTSRPGDGNPYTHRFKVTDVDDAVKPHLTRGNKFIYDLALDPAAPDPTKHRKAINLRVDVSNPGLAAPVANPIAIVTPPPNRRIDVLPPRAMDKELIVSAHYYENNSAKDDVVLYAYAADKDNAKLKALLDLPDEDDNPFSLFTSNYGIASAKVLLSELPKGCTRIIVEGPDGVRGFKEIGKETQKYIKSSTTAEADKKKPKEYKMDVVITGPNDLSVTVKGDGKPTKAMVRLRATGNRPDEVHFTELISNQTATRFGDFQSEKGVFEFVVDYPLASADISIMCPEANTNISKILMR